MLRAIFGDVGGLIIARLGARTAGIRTLTAGSAVFPRLHALGHLKFLDLQVLVQRLHRLVPQALGVPRLGTDHHLVVIIPEPACRRIVGRAAGLAKTGFQLLLRQHLGIRLGFFKILGDDLPDLLGCHAEIRRHIPQTILN